MPLDGPYSFRAVGPADRPLLRSWLATPHVREWWGEPEGELAEIYELIADHTITAFIVETALRPIGYIQCYMPAGEPGHPYADQPQGTYGIDQFIGEADCIGYGHGPAFIQAFCAILEQQGAAGFVTDPDPANRRAIRAYEKAGFRPIDRRMIDDGEVVLMRRDIQEMRKQP